MFDTIFNAVYTVIAWIAMVACVLAVAFLTIYILYGYEVEWVVWLVEEVLKWA